MTRIDSLSAKLTRRISQEIESIPAIEGLEGPRAYTIGSLIRSEVGHWTRREDRETLSALVKWARAEARALALSGSEALTEDGRIALAAFDDIAEIAEREIEQRRDAHDAKAERRIDELETEVAVLRHDLRTAEF